MIQIIPAPTVIQAAGHPPKRIEEFVGRVNSGTSAVSVARMTSPSGWKEPGQTPEFDEFTVVLRGELQVETREGVHRVAAGAGDHRDGGGVDSLQYAGGGRGGVSRSVPAGVFAGDGASR